MSKRKKILAIIGSVFLVLILLGAGAFLYLTSEAGIKSIILPRVASGLHAKFDVANIQLHTFSSLELRHLVVKPDGKDTLLEADRVYVRYQLSKILSGHYLVDEVTLESPIIHLITYPDGSSNLDPITKGSADKPPTKSSESKKLDLDIRKISITSGTVEMVATGKLGERTASKISNLNLSIDELKNDAPGKLTIQGNLTHEQNGTNSAQVAGKIDGAINYRLDQNLMPLSIQGDLSAAIAGASGSFSQFSNLSIQAKLDATPREIGATQISLVRNGTPLGAIRLSGPFDMAKKEGSLQLTLDSVDRNLLNIAGASSGVDFGTTRLSSTNQITLASGGQSIHLKGFTGLNQLTLIRTNQAATPKIEAGLAYEIDVDNAQKKATIQGLEIQALQNGAPFVQTHLSQPLPISWGGTSASTGTAALDLVITNFSLADWKSVTGQDIAGRLDSTLRIVSDQGGQQVSFKLDTSLQNLSAKMGSNDIQNINVAVDATGSLGQMKQLMLTNATIAFSRDGTALGNIQVSGPLDIAKNEGSLQLTVNSIDKNVLNIAGAASGIDFGTTKLSSTNQVTLSQGGNAIHLKGSTGLNQLSLLRTNAQATPKIEAQIAYDVAVDSAQKKATVQSLDVHATQNNAPLITTHLSQPLPISWGGATAATGAADMNIVLTNFSLADWKSVTGQDLSGKVNTTLRIVSDKGGQQMSFGFVLSIQNLNAKIGTNDIRDLNLGIDAGGTLAQMKQLLLTNATISMPATQRAKNQIRMTANVDATKADAIKADLKISSDSFDATPWYDLFAAKPVTNSAAVKNAKAKVAEIKLVVTNAPAAKSPIEQLHADLNFGRLYLRELDISNLQATATISSNHLVLNPCKLTLNGGLVSANADLGMSTNQHFQVTFSADRVPLAPLADSFMPDKKSQYQGNIIANATVQGNGFEGVDLKKALNGKAQLIFTNANIQVVSGFLKAILVPVSIVLRIPELTQSPISSADVGMTFGNGAIQLDHAVVVSAAFHANAHGPIPIADILTNSPVNQVAVDFQLRRSLAEKSSLLPANTPTNAAFVSLPTFLKLAGTIGDPKSDIQEKAIAGMLLQSTAGFLGTGKGSALQGIGGLLTGQSGQSSTSPAQTNSTGTAAGALKSITGIFSGQSSPPPAGTTNTAARPTNNIAAPVNQLLDLFKKSK